VQTATSPQPVEKVSTTCGQGAEIGYNKYIGSKATDFPNYPLFSNMRKIESEMNAAVLTRRNFSKANTSVTINDRIAEVRLHGNLIARVGDNFVQILDGGWQSVTTKSRLNALLSDVTPDGGVFQKDYVWYYNSSKVGTVPFMSGMEAV